MVENILTILCVKTDKGCFISDCTATSGYDYTYHCTKLTNLLFDGEKPTSTYYPNWYYIKQYPMFIQKEIAGQAINPRYELNDTSLESDKMPKVIPYENRDNYNSDLFGLYEYKYDIAPTYFEDVPCNIQVVCEIDNYNFPPKLEYNAVHRVDWSDTKYTITNTEVQHQMLDKIIFPAVMLHERPCKFTSVQMYNITRQYILDHIDNSVAKITSNYDFCFTVKKLIPLIEPETITYHNIFARTKRERSKIHTTIKKFEEKEIFEMTHDQKRYDNYTVIPEVCANSEAELKEKVDTWLEGLMAAINEPLCQCPHCQGTGYVGEIKKLGFIKE
jgi:hypothetical protein